MAPHTTKPGLTIGYRAGGNRQKCFLDLQSVSTRDEIISSLVAATGGEAVKGDREFGFWEATWPPSLSLAAAMLVAAGLAALARPGGFSEDPLVKFLQSVGPTRVLIAAAVPAFVLFGWLIKRAMFPPSAEVLQLRGGRLSNESID